MASSSTTTTTPTPKLSPNTYIRTWGESSLPPTLLATLLTALHGRPPQFLPLLFPPVLLFSTYLNISGYVVNAAGITAAWSGLYLLLAARRRPKIKTPFGNGNGLVRRAVRGVSIGVCVANLVAGGWVYGVGKRGDDGDGEGGVV